MDVARAFIDRSRHYLVREYPTKIQRCLEVLPAESPSMDKGEATDKGSINQRAVLSNRAALVEALYAAPLPAAAIALKAP